MFLVLEIQSKDSGNKYSGAQAWVKASTQEDAHMIISKKMEAEDFKILTILECEKTGKEDYFEPCKSLDAFICAEREKG